eukprot:143865_1
MQKDVSDLSNLITAQNKSPRNPVSRLSTTESKQTSALMTWPTELLSNEAYVTTFACIKCNSIPLTCMNDENGEILCGKCAQKVNNTSPNIAVQNMIDKLETKCLTLSEGNVDKCEWIGTIKEWINHKNQCQYVSVECDGCKILYQRKFLHKHLSECAEASIYCPLSCGSAILRKNVKIHCSIQCSEKLIDCINDGCMEQIKRKDFTNHTTKDCFYREIQCKFAKYGCDITVKDIDSWEHNRDYDITHLVNKLIFFSVKKAKQECLYFDVGDTINARDRFGKWYKANIIAHKKAKEDIPKKPELSNNQKTNIQKFKNLEGIYVHYHGFEEKWDEWIFIDPNETICECKTMCEVDETKHRVRNLNTTSEIMTLKTEITDKQSKINALRNEVDELKAELNDYNTVLDRLKEYVYILFRNLLMVSLVAIVVGIYFQIYVGPSAVMTETNKEQNCVSSDGKSYLAYLFNMLAYVGSYICIFSIVFFISIISYDDLSDFWKVIISFILWILCQFVIGFNNDVLNVESLQLWLVFISMMVLVVIAGKVYIIVVPFHFDSRSDEIVCLFVVPFTVVLCFNQWFWLFSCNDFSGVPIAVLFCHCIFYFFGLYHKFMLMSITQLAVINMCTISFIVWLWFNTSWMIVLFELLYLPLPALWMENHSSFLPGGNLKLVLFFVCGHVFLWMGFWCAYWIKSFVEIDDLMQNEVVNGVVLIVVILCITLDFQFRRRIMIFLKTL